MSLTFRQFVKRRADPKDRPVHTFRGGPSCYSRDFMSDMLSDRNFPRKVQSFDDLYRYLHRISACEGAVWGAMDTWADWVLWRVSRGEYE